MTYRLSLLVLVGCCMAVVGCPSSDPDPNPAPGGGGTGGTSQDAAAETAQDAAQEDAAVIPTCAMGSSAGVHIASTSPTDGQTRVLRTVQVSLTMSEEIACTGANANPTFTLTNPGGESVGIVNYQCDGTVLTFQPQKQLDYATEYTLTLGGLVDNANQPIATCQISFTTKTKTAAVKTWLDYSASLDDDGTLWLWGDEMDVPINGILHPTIPSIVNLPMKATSFAVGMDTLFAVLDDGTVRAWGGNFHGQLGDGTTNPAASSSIQVALNLPSGVKITHVSAATYHVVALRSDGKVMGWGLDQAGELVAIGSADKLTPVEIQGLSDVIAVAAGDGSSGHGTPEGGFTLALKSDGTVWGRGSNAFGALGAIPTDTDLDLVQTTGVSGIKAIAAGSDQAFALSQDGHVYAWGSNLSGALGDNTCHADVPLPAVQVLNAQGSAPMDNVTNISGGEAFGLLVRDGLVWGWGRNHRGQLGDGTFGPNETYCRPDFPADASTQKLPVQAVGISNAIMVSAGRMQSLVLLEDGTVWAAGDNVNNKLGLPSNAPAIEDAVPQFTQVPGL